MRISDWSSDVCSSDLLMTSVVGTQHLLALAERCGADFLFASTSEVYGDPQVHPQREDYFEIGRASGRERVCQYVSISVVAGSLKNKTTQNPKNHRHMNSEQDQ